jgi:hypothetical protein
MVWFCAQSPAKGWVPKANAWVLAVFAQRVNAPGQRYWADRSGAISLALAQPQLDAIADACRQH